MNKQATERRQLVERAVGRPLSDAEYAEESERTAAIARASTTRVTRVFDHVRSWISRRLVAVADRFSPVF